MLESFEHAHNVPTDRTDLSFMPQSHRTTSSRRPNDKKNAKSVFLPYDHNGRTSNGHVPDITDITVQLTDMTLR